MSKKKLKGVVFRPVYFQPTYQKGMGQVCAGVQLHMTDANQYRPFKTGVCLLMTMAKQAGGNFMWKQPPYEYEHKRMPIDLIAGTAELRRLVETQSGLKEFEARCRADVEKFRKLRATVLLYR